MMMPDQGQQPTDPNMISALLAQLGGGGAAGVGMGAPETGGESEAGQYSPGDLPRQLIELTHEAIRMEPDASDKSLLGKILSMLLQYQERQAAQGQ
jgi:hypothetical protein